MRAKKYKTGLERVPFCILLVVWKWEKWKRLGPMEPNDPNDWHDWQGYKVHFCKNKVCNIYFWHIQPDGGPN